MTDLFRRFPTPNSPQRTPAPPHWAAADYEQFEREADRLLGGDRSVLGLQQSVADRGRSVGQSPGLRKLAAGVGDNPNVRNINPDDAFGINAHAIFGDGSPREADFTKVNLADLPASLTTIASQPGSRFNAAIVQAQATGKPQPLRMTQVRAGGGEGGNTNSQRGGVGRFSVTVDGVVTPGPAGGWTYTAKAIGEPDKQDYPHDPRRGAIAGALNDAFGVVQKIVGGKDYPLTFFGEQDVKVSGVKK